MNIFATLTFQLDFNFGVGLFKRLEKSGITKELGIHEEGANIQKGLMQKLKENFGNLPF